MIADLDETLRQLLVAELPVKNGEVEISFDQPRREWSGRLNRPTVNLFLYDLRENATLRHHDVERISQKSTAGGLAYLKRSPYRVDCQYMLTTWASDPEDEHRLLGRCALALFRFPTLPEERLVGSLQGQPYEVQARLAVHDKLTNPAEIWSALDNEIRPSLPYIVTLAMDPWSEVSEPVVRTVRFRSGVADGLPRRSHLSEMAGVVEQVAISGTVRQKSKDNAPLSGIDVAIKGTGLFSKTDEQGRYVLGSLPPGSYTLLVWASQDRPQEKAISIPTTGEDYDLLIP